MASSKVSDTLCGMKRTNSRAPTYATNQRVPPLRDRFLTNIHTAHAIAFGQHLSELACVSDTKSNGLHRIKAARVFQAVGCRSTESVITVLLFSFISILLLHSVFPRTLRYYFPRQMTISEQLLQGHRRAESDEEEDCEEQPDAEQNEMPTSLVCCVHLLPRNRIGLRLQRLLFEMLRHGLFLR